MSEIDELGASYTQALETYKQARIDQQRLIVKALGKAGFTTLKGESIDQNINTRSLMNHGNKGYSSRKLPLLSLSGEVKVLDYDLSQWRWICARRGPVFVIISLQCCEQDSNTKNMHALLDHLSLEIFVYHGDKNPIDENNYPKAKLEAYGQAKLWEREVLAKTLTEFSLPMTEEKLEGFCALIEQEIAKGPKEVFLCSSD